MKITAIRLTRMRLPLDPPFYAAWDPVPRRHFDATLVRVETDEGITGYGSGDTMDGFEPFESLFTGRDPLSIADHVKTIESIGFHAGRYWPLEAALWDIAGQVTGQPVSVLFGGASRRLPAYASFGEARSPQARAQAAVAAKAAGFRAMKIRISRTDWVSSLEAVRATRAAVGEDVAIMADLNQWWRMAGDLSPALDETQVRRIAAELAELGVFWLEEPLPGGDLDGMRALRGQIRVAGGEMARTPAELLDALAAGALDVLQPDVVPRGRPAAHQDHRRAGPAAAPLVHPAHLDQRPRPAGQPARGGRRGRRPLRRVPLRPARLDPRTPRLLPDRAGPHRRRRLPGRPRRPRPRRQHRPRRRGPLRAASPEEPHMSAIDGFTIAPKPATHFGVGAIEPAARVRSAPPAPPRGRGDRRRARGDARDRDGHGRAGRRGPAGPPVLRRAPQPDHRRPGRRRRSRRGVRRRSRRAGAAAASAVRPRP